MWKITCPTLDTRVPELAYVPADPRAGERRGRHDQFDDSNGGA